MTKAVTTAVQAHSRFEWAGAPVDIEWQVPSRAVPAGLMLLQHGFGRRCANLRGTARAVAAQGLVTLCLNADMAGGNPALAAALAAALVQGLDLPGGGTLPTRLVVAGHSAGAHFALEVAARLARDAPGRLAGLILLDPVGGRGFAALLEALPPRDAAPLLAVGAPPSPCNAQAAAQTAIAAAAAQLAPAGAAADATPTAATRAGRPSAFSGLRLVEAPTHVDAEGEDTDGLAVWACGQGRPRPGNTEILRTLAARWAVDLVLGERDADAYPGRPFVDALLANGRAVLIEADGPCAARAAGLCEAGPGASTSPGPTGPR